MTFHFSKQPSSQFNQYKTARSFSGTGRQAVVKNDDQRCHGVEGTRLSKTVYVVSILSQDAFM